MNNVLDNLYKLMDLIGNCSMTDDEKQDAMDLCDSIHAGIVDKSEDTKDTKDTKDTTETGPEKSDNEDWGGEQANDLKEWMKALQDSSSRGC